MEHGPTPVKLPSMQDQRPQEDPHIITYASRRHKRVSSAGVFSPFHLVKQHLAAGEHKKDDTPKSKLLEKKVALSAMWK
jgi:hypothetical protein